MRSVAVAAALLVLAACSQKPGPPENQGAANEKVTAEANVSGNVTAMANQSNATGNETAKLPPASSAHRFVGTWATSQANCKSKPWIFTADSLHATGGPECSFYKVSNAPGGYDIAATCPTKQPVHTDLFKLRFAESAGAMLVESNAISPTGLIYCGK